MMHEAPATRCDAPPECVDLPLNEAAVARRHEDNLLAGQICLFDIGPDRRRRPKHPNGRHKEDMARGGDVDRVDTDRRERFAARIRECLPLTGEVAGIVGVDARDGCVKRPSNFPGHRLRVT